MWPFRRQRKDVDTAVRRAGRGEWRDLAVMPTVSATSFSTIDTGFDHALATRSDPTFLAPLGHHLVPDGPSGTVRGVAAASRASAGPPVQRQFTSPPPDHGQWMSPGNPPIEMPVPAVAPASTPVATPVTSMVKATETPLPSVPVGRVLTDEPETAEVAPDPRPEEAHEEQATTQPPDTAGPASAEAVELPLLGAELPTDVSSERATPAAEKASPRRLVGSQPQQPATDVVKPVAARIGEPLVKGVAVQPTPLVGSPEPAPLAAGPAAITPPSPAGANAPLAGEGLLEATRTLSANASVPSRPRVAIGPPIVGRLPVDGPAPASDRPASDEVDAAAAADEASMPDAPHANVTPPPPNVVSRSLIGDEPLTPGDPEPDRPSHSDDLMSGGQPSTISVRKPANAPRTVAGAPDAVRHAATSAAPAVARTIDTPHSVTASMVELPPARETPGRTVERPIARPIARPGAATPSAPGEVDLPGDRTPVLTSTSPVTALDTSPATASDAAPDAVDLLGERPLTTTTTTTTTATSSSAAAISRPVAAISDPIVQRTRLADTSSAELIAAGVSEAPAVVPRPAAMVMRALGVEPAPRLRVQRTSSERSAPPTGFVPPVVRSEPTLEAASMPAGEIQSWTIAPDVLEALSDGSTFVQRQADAAEPQDADSTTTATATAAPGPATAAVAPASPQATKEPNMHELFRALYPALHRRLCRDLLLDRERAGYRTDIRF